MTRVDITNFSRGIADDYVRATPGECSHVRQFDIFTYPYRLQPLRGMTAANEPSGTAISNMILSATGAIMFAVGEDPGNPGNGELYKKAGFGATDYWTDFSSDQLSGVANTASSIDFLVHFPEQIATRKLYWAGTNLLVVSDPADGGSSTDTESLTFTTIGQGLVHPKDKTLYFPYQTSTKSLIGKIQSHASDAFGTVNYTAFEFPSRYRAYCLSHFADYLAIPMTPPGIQGNSVVGLWNRDTSLTTLSETINWGPGALKVLNNLSGALIGVSVLSAETSAAAQDVDKIQVKVYTGGAEPFLVKELIATRTTSTAPACTLQHRVNFIANDRLYFSATITNGDSDANYVGLFSVGKNKFGEWTVIQERVSTNDNSETSIIAAAMYGDYLTCAHTSNGTLTRTVNGNTLSAIYEATSVYESVINPEMPSEHRHKRKVLKSIYATYLPLATDAQVVVKYRKDTLRSGSWTTVFTETTDGATRTERTNAAGEQFGEFTNLELRIESVGGGIITGFGYTYDVLDHQA